MALTNASASAPQPRTRQRSGNFPYLYVIHEDYTYKESGWRLAQPFEAEWLRIGLSGEITIKANQQGYAWDGCTPKRSLLNLAIIGVPDGHVDYRTGLPYTYHASLVHDALYQYLDTIPVTKSQVDQLFLEMLGDFKLRRLYYWMVRLFGARRVVQRGVQSAA